MRKEKREKLIYILSLVLLIVMIFSFLPVIL